MNNGWISDEIDNLCNVEYGTRVVQKNDGGTIYPVYGGGGATFNIDIYNRENRLTIARFAMSAKCTRFVKGKFYLNDSGLTLSPKESEKLNQEFLDYQCLHMNNIFYSLAKGSAQKNLDVPAFRKLKINYPKDLSSQKKIVRKLDAILYQIDKAISSTESNIKNTDFLLNASLNSIFSAGETVPLKDICEISMGQSPSGDSYNTTGDGVPLINGPVEFGKESFSETIKSKFTTKPTKMCKAGDLILCVRGSTTGRMNIAGFDACIGRGVASLRAKDNQDWINYFIFSNRNKIYSLGKGATFPNISSNDIANLRIHNPSPSEKREKLIKLELIKNSTDTMKISYFNKRSQLLLLRESVLRSAFVGELIKE